MKKVGTSLRRRTTFVEAPVVEMFAKIAHLRQELKKEQQL